MERSDHEGLGEDLEEDADRMEDEVEEVGDDIDEVRRDWEAKKEDSSVPGAQADEEDVGPVPPEADIAPGDRAS